MSTMHGSTPQNAPADGQVNGHPQPSIQLGDPKGKFGLHHILRTGFPGLQTCFEAQEILCQAWMPNVAKILVCQACMSFGEKADVIVQNHHMIHPSSYATKWYITLYTSSTFEFSAQLRIWDAFLLEGTELLVIIALAILWGLKGILFRRCITCQAYNSQTDYIQHPKADFESIMNSLSGSYVIQNEDAFMEWCRKRLKRWKKGRVTGKIEV